MPKKSHKDVEFAVQTYTGEEVFRTFEEAARFAIEHAAVRGTTVELDVLVWSRAGAKWWGGDIAVEQYDDDPDASAFDSFEIKVKHTGKVY